MTDSFTWATQFSALFGRCAMRYRKGDTHFEAWFGSGDLEFLASIGCKPREFFDFVDDHCQAGGAEPTKETALLIAAVRRDYFLVEQKGVTGTKIIRPSELPPKPAELDGIPWLPRIIVKAEAKLRGEMDPDTMFGCGGDMVFCAKFHLHPADFLRVVWAARGDTAKILQFVKSGKMA
jgi:hypothetical protein